MGLFIDYGLTDVESRRCCYQWVSRYLKQLAFGVFTGGEFVPIRRQTNVGDRGNVTNQQQLRRAEDIAYQHFVKDPLTCHRNSYTGQVDSVKFGIKTYTSSFMKQVQLIRNFRKGILILNFFIKFI